MVSGIKKSRFPFPRVLYRLGRGRYTAPMPEVTSRRPSLAFEVSSLVRLLVALCPELLRVFCRFALALAMVLVCAGTVSACPSVAHFEFTAEFAAQEQDFSGCFGSENHSEPAQGFTASQSFPEFDVAAIEFDVDDHELLSNPGPLSLALVLHSVLCFRENVFTVSRATDTSRPVASTGLPRGPPTLS